MQSVGVEVRAGIRFVHSRHKVAIEEETRQLSGTRADIPIVDTFYHTLWVESSASAADRFSNLNIMAWGHRAWSPIDIAPRDQGLGCDPIVADNPIVFHGLTPPRGGGILYLGGDVTGYPAASSFCH